MNKKNNHHFINNDSFETILIVMAVVVFGCFTLFVAPFGLTLAIITAFLVNLSAEKYEKKKKIIYYLIYLIVIICFSAPIYKLLLIAVNSYIFKLTNTFISTSKLSVIFNVMYLLSILLSIFGSYYLVFKAENKRVKPYFNIFFCWITSSRLNLLYTSLIWLSCGVFIASVFHENVFFRYFNHSYFLMNIDGSLKSLGFFPAQKFIETFNSFALELLFVVFTVFLIGVVVELIFKNLHSLPASSPFRGLLNKNQDIIIGKIDGKGLVLRWSDINHHIHIIGQSGAGKSVLLRNIYSGLIAKNSGLMMIDLKGESSLKNEFLSLIDAANNNQKIGFFDLDKPHLSVKYNPLLRGNAIEIKDKFMLSFNWSEEYYRKKAEGFFNLMAKVVVLFRDELGELLTVFDLYNVINNPLEALYLREKIPIDHIELKDDLESFYLDLTSKFGGKKDLSGVKTDLEILCKSSISSVICSHESIDLMDLITSESCLLATLDGQRYGDSAKRIAKMFVADLRACSGHIVSNTVPENRTKFTFIVDEFADIIDSKEFGSSFANLLNRSRSSNIGCIIAHQSLGDFSDEQVKKQIIDNTESLFCFVQKDDETAEKVSKMIGTKETKKSTSRQKKELFIHRNTGDLSVREVESFIIHPNKIKNIDKGSCIYLAKKPTRFGTVQVKYSKGFVDSNLKRSSSNSLNLKVMKKYSKVALSDETLQRFSIDTPDSITQEDHIHSMLNLNSAELS